MKLIIGNWKENPQTLKQAKALLLALNKIKALHKTVLCPPAVYLPLLPTKYDLGAQDLFWEENGAHTSQISGSILKQFKVKYAIIGHSERRSLGETEEQVNLKVKAALKNKITPVLCVGYGLTAEMGDEEVLTSLQRQLNENLSGAEAKKVIVAYEPVWAISKGDPHKTKKIPTPDHAERIAMFIRIKFKTAKVLYGGSISSENAKAFLTRQIDGLLVGGASLDPKEFQQIITTKA